MLQNEKSPKKQIQENIQPFFGEVSSHPKVLCQIWPCGTRRFGRVPPDNGFKIAVIPKQIEG